jgi:hypothetical protein
VDLGNDSTDIDHETFSRFPALSESLRPRPDILRRLCRMTAATSAVSVLLEDDFSAVCPVAMRVKGNELVEVDPSQAMGDFNLLARSNPMTGPFLKKLVSGMMKPIALVRHELVDDFNWYSSDYVSQHRLRRGLDDCLYSAVDLPGRKPFLELICLNRSSMNRLAFTARDSQNVCTAHVAYNAIDRTDPDALLGAAGHPGTSRQDPDAELQKVLQHALQGENEEQLCLSVGVDRGQLQQHLKTLYREFQVVSLADLTKRWGKRRHLPN